MNTLYPVYGARRTPSNKGDSPQTHGLTDHIWSLQIVVIIPMCVLLWVL